MARHEFEIPVHNLDAGGRPFEFPVRAAWLRGALEETDVAPGGTDGTLSVRGSTSGTDVVIDGHLHVTLTVPCARCTEPAPVEVDQPLQLLFVPKGRIRGSKGMNDEYEFAADEAEVLTYEDNLVILDDAVRDEVLLAIPMIPLCRDDCPGMSPGPQFSGKDRDQPADPEDPAADDVDPRLRPLLRFKPSTKE
jgi:uncharacterized protein